MDKKRVRRKCIVEDRGNAQNSRRDDSWNVRQGIYIDLGCPGGAPSDTALITGRLTEPNRTRVGAGRSGSLSFEHNCGAMADQS